MPRPVPNGNMLCVMITFSIAGKLVGETCTDNERVYGETMSLYLRMAQGQPQSYKIAVTSAPGIG